MSPPPLLSLNSLECLKIQTKDKKNIEEHHQKRREEALEKNKRTSFHSEEWNRTQLEITMPKKHSSVVKNTAEGGKDKSPPLFKKKKRDE